MAINESLENYLERVLIQQKLKGYARSSDIARALSVSRPSVSHAMRLLREEGYVLMDSGNLITLTPKGMKVAKRMLERHMGIAQLLMRLGVDEETAYADACRMEHDISQQTFEALRRLNTQGLQPLSDHDGKDKPGP